MTKIQLRTVTHYFRQIANLDLLEKRASMDAKEYRYAYPRLTDEQIELLRESVAVANKYRDTH